MLVGSIQTLGDILASIKTYPCDFAIYAAGDLPYKRDTPAAVLHESSILEEDWVDVLDKKPPFAIYKLRWARDMRTAQEIVDVAINQVGYLDVGYVVKAFNHYLAYDAILDGPTLDPGVVCFETLLTFPPLPALALYARDEQHHLVVAPGGAVPDGVQRAWVGTLELLVGSCSQLKVPDYTFVGIDGYTPSKYWKRAPLAIPSISAEMALQYLKPTVDLGVHLHDYRIFKYTYCPESSLLLMRIGIEEVVRRIRCLSCVVAGLGSQGELAELWIEGVHVTA